MERTAADFARLWAAESAPQVEDAPIVAGDDDAAKAVALIESGAPLVLVSGRAGTGKSRLIAQLRQGPRGARTLTVAPTGIAALNLGVPTIHAAFQLPLGCIEAALLPPSPRPMGALRAASRLIIDEISMVRADVLDAIDARLCQVRGSKAPFGGVQVVMVGDFLQLPPVVRDEDAAVLQGWGYATPFAFSAHALQDTPMVATTLRHVWRQSDPSFKAALADVRSGRRTQEAVSWLNAQCLGPHRAGREPLILTATRAAADAYNAEGLARIFAQHPPVVFRADRVGSFEDSAAAPAPDVLELAPGARVVALRNDPRGAFANGSLGVVVATRLVEGEVPAVQVLFDGASAPLWVERADWERTRAVWSAQEGKLVEEPVGAFRQVPLAPGYALTIHKCQGLTLDDVRIDLGRGAFAPGQLYVALSRARTIEGLSFAQALSPSDARVDPMLLRFLEWADTRALS